MYIQILIAVLLLFIMLRTDSARADITFPKVVKLLLMFAPSFSRVPLAPVDSALSEPARSTRDILLTCDLKSNKFVTWVKHVTHSEVHSMDLTLLLYYNTSTEAPLFAATSLLPFLLLIQTLGHVCVV